MNIKEEFLKIIKNKKVVCAKILFDMESYDDVKKILLKLGYESHEFEEFLNKLDFDYDNSYGIQQLFGTIWFDDCSWAERAEYDGSEWWEIRELPKIDNELIGMYKI